MRHRAILRGSARIAAGQLTRTLKRRIHDRSRRRLGVMQHGVQDRSCRCCRVGVIRDRPWGCRGPGHTSIERTRERAHGLEAGGRILLQRAHHRGFHLGGQIADEAMQRRRRLLHLRFHQREVGLAIERGAAGQQRVQHDAERIDVGAHVGLRTADLLGRHRPRSAGNLAEARQALLAVERTRDAEVHDLHLAVVRQHDVGGLDVAVHDAALMRMLDAVERAPKDAQRPLDRHRAAAADELVERDSRHVLHDHELLVAFVQERMDARDVGMAELGVELRLLGEAFEEERVGSELVAQHLDRDLALEHHVFGLEDLPDAARAQSLGDQVGADAAADEGCRDGARRRVALRFVAGLRTPGQKPRRPVGNAHHHS